MMREKIKFLIKKSLQILQKEEKLGDFKLEEIKIERPSQRIFGDYSTNLAMIIGKKIKKDSLVIAKILVYQLNSLSVNQFEKIEIAKPGFINFFLAKEYLQKQIGEILKQKEKFGDLKIGKDKKVQVEFISANPTGPLHIGHGRGAFFGDCLANVLTKVGFRVRRQYYINDARVNTQIKTLGKTAIGEDTAYLNDYLLLKINQKKSKIEKIVQKLKDKEKISKEVGYLLAQEIQKDIKKFIEKELKIKFDSWVSEENLYKKNKVKKIYNFLKKKGLVYSREGAEWLKISQFSAPKDEVIIRQNGEPSYFLADIAYHQEKFSQGYKKIINIWGADHQGHIPRMKAVAKILGYKGDLEILISQVVRLKGEKISKRKGKIITLKWLIDEVSLDVARFFYLMKSLNTQMEFDVKLAKEKSEKNPVYYIQYAHCRILSILRKLKNRKQKIENKNYSLLNHSSELNLIKQLIRLPEVIEDIARDYQVQRLPQYALDLVTAFHKFYEECRVITDDKNLTQARLDLIEATKIILKNTLDLMRISAPQKM